MYDKELQEILDKIKKYAPNADVTPVIKAYELAKSAHAGVFRKSGEPYIIHPIASRSRTRYGSYSSRSVT